MTRRSLFSLLLLALLAGVPACSQAAFDAPTAETLPASATQATPLRVLFIGNSYTYYNNLPGMVQQLAAGGDRSVETEMVAYGGATLEVHWERGDGPGRIRSGGWDYVVLQEQSTRPMDNREAFFRYARLFDQAIEAAGAETVFYMTWARENNPDSQASLTSAYETIARELGAGVAPVGEAWATARRTAADLHLFDDDGSHPNPTGSYLAASVFYATLLDATPSGATGTIRDPESRTVLVRLGDDDAARLQQIAWSAAR